MSTYRAVQGTIGAIACAVPKRTVRNADFTLPGLEPVHKLTGVLERRWVEVGQRTSTLCMAAVKSLLDDGAFKPAELAAIIVVTQTADSKMPGVSHLIHGEIGAPRMCIAFDVNLACSGYIYGLYLAMQQARAAGAPVLLVTGDTTSRLLASADKSTVGLFGDAASATLVRPSNFASTFVLGSDGKGADKLKTSYHRTFPEIIEMNGPDVMNFALHAVPAIVNDLRKFSPGAETPTYYFHQANKFILDHIVKKCEIDPQDAPSNIAKFGNTSSTSIPLLLCDFHAGKRQMNVFESARLIGFGAGYSWGGCATAFRNTHFSPIVEVR